MKPRNTKQSEDIRDHIENSRLLFSVGTALAFMAFLDPVGFDLTLKAMEKVVDTRIPRVVAKAKRARGKRQ